MRHRALWHLQHMPSQTDQLLPQGCEEKTCHTDLCLPTYHIMSQHGTSRCILGEKVVSFMWTCVT